MTVAVPERTVSGTVVSVVDVLAPRPRVTVSEIPSESLLTNAWRAVRRLPFRVDYLADARTWARTVGAFAVTQGLGVGLVWAGAPTWVWWALVPAWVTVAANELDLRHLWRYGS